MQGHSHKINRVIIASIVIAVASILISVYFRFFDEGEKNAEPKSGYSETASLTSKDSDGDGLFDWEETLWRTNVNEKDSDGDGDSDGDEVRINRNPLKKGPDDKFTAEELKAIELQTSDIYGKTETEKFSREFLVKYLISKKQDEELTEEDRKKLIDGLIEAYSKSLTAKTYSKSDLKISPDESATSLRNYGNKLGALFIVNSPQRFSNEMASFKAFLESENPISLREIDPLIKSYKAVLTGSLALDVPENAFIIHLAFINGLSQYIESLEALRAGDTDALRATWGISVHINNAENLKKNLEEIKTYFSQKNIIFQQFESGSAITTGV